MNDERNLLIDAMRMTRAGIDNEMLMVELVAPRTKTAIYARYIERVRRMSDHVAKWQAAYPGEAIPLV